MNETKKAVISINVNLESGECTTHIEGRGGDLLTTYSLLARNMMDTLVKERPPFADKKSAAEASAELLQKTFALGISNYMAEIESDVEPESKPERKSEHHTRVVRIRRRGEE